jgi:hypothetical protein
VEALRKKEREDETQFTTKIGGNILVWVPFVLLKKFHQKEKIETKKLKMK